MLDMSCYVNVMCIVFHDLDLNVTFLSTMACFGIVLLPFFKQSSLESYIKQLTSLADRLQNMQLFIDDVTALCCQTTISDKLYMSSRTFQAFACSLSRILGDFRQCVARMEKAAARQGKSSAGRILDY